MKLSNGQVLLLSLIAQGISFYLINKKLNKMGKVNEEVKQIVSDLDTATNKVAEKIDKAIADLENGTVEETTLQSLRSASIKLKAIAHDAEQPVPDVVDNDDDDDVVSTGDVTTGGGTTGGEETGGGTEGGGTTDDSGSLNSSRRSRR